MKFRIIEIQKGYYVDGHTGYKLQNENYLPFWVRADELHLFDMLA
jgi:hypothetical protein